MADANVNPGKTRVVVEEEPTVTLTLTMDEAIDLRTMMGQCAAKGITWNVFAALDNAGVKYGDGRVKKNEYNLIYFEGGLV